VSRQVVARASEVVPGTSKIVTVKGRDIGIFNIDGSYFALANRGPHAGGPLCSGRIVPLAMSDGPGHYRLARHQDARSDHRSWPPARMPTPWATQGRWQAARGGRMHRQ